MFQKTLPSPASPGYIIPEDLAAVRKDPEEAVAFVTHGSPQSIREHPSTSLIADITPYLGPVRVVLLLYGGRRRPGHVAHFCEKCAASVALGGFQLAVCVVDIVHGAQHDISRGATEFWIPLI